MNEKLNALAGEVADDMVKNEGTSRVKAFDPATLDIILQIVTFIINLFKKKNPSPSAVKSQAQNTNLLQRFLIKNKLKRYMRDNSKNYEAYQEHKDTALKSALRKIGSAETTTLEGVMSEVPPVADKYVR